MSAKKESGYFQNHDHLVLEVITMAFAKNLTKHSPNSQLL